MWVFIPLSYPASSLALAALGALTGGVIGAAQWIILHRQVRRAGWWVLVQVVNWSLISALSFSESLLLLEWDYVGLGLIGLVSGAITAIPMTWLLRHPVQRLGEIPPLLAGQQRRGRQRDAVADSPGREEQ